MTTKWLPSDDELDAEARALPIAERDAVRVEQGRTSVLARAAGATQLRRGSRAPMIAAAGGALAAAAAVLLWLAVRPADPRRPNESITALGPAQYERVATWPDFVVRLEDGRIEVKVTSLAMNERFRVATADAEVEVRGTQFVVGAAHGKITSVSVSDGRVEVRWAHEASIFLSAGQSWSPTRTAQRDEAPPSAPESPPAPAAPSTASTMTGPSSTRPDKHTAAITATNDANATPTTPTTPTTTTTTATTATPTTPATPTTTATTATPTTPTTTATTATPTTSTTPTTTTTTLESPAPSPGEADFRAGIAALRASRVVDAVTAFARACKAAEKDALGEDACFWLGAAAKRAGQTKTARDALARFLARYPRSARAGEASALLGWLLYDAGELDDAEQRFNRAVRDRVPEVKDSATRGLEAIRRKRAP